MGHPGKKFGALADDPLSAHDSGRLFVGEEREQQRPAGDDSLASEMTDHRQHHPDHIFHIHGSTPVEPAVADLPRKRRDCPVLRHRRNHVDVPVHDETTGVRVRAFDSREETAASGHGLDELARDADVIQILGDPSAHPGLAIADRGGVPGVGRVDGYQVSRDRDGFRMQLLARLIGHRLGVGHPKHFPSPR